MVLSFDQRQGSSDGGAVLLQAANQRYESMASCLRDERQAGKVEHTLIELLGQRIHGLACGYPDANDAVRLESDPVHKLLGAMLAARPSILTRPTMRRTAHSSCRSSTRTTTTGAICR